MIASIIMIIFWIVSLWFSLKFCMKMINKAEQKGLLNDE